MRLCQQSLNAKCRVEKERERERENEAAQICWPYPPDGTNNLAIQSDSISNRLPPRPPSVPSKGRSTLPLPPLPSHLFLFKTVKRKLAVSALSAKLALCSGFTHTHTHTHTHSASAPLNPYTIHPSRP